jgi:hypothetical protein
VGTKSFGSVLLRWGQVLLQKALLVRRTFFLVAFVIILPLYAIGAALEVVFHDE